MAQPRSRRLRLLESLRRTINEMLHERVHRAARSRGHLPPQSTASIYTSASEEAPELLDQLLFVHRRVDQEKGEEIRAAAPNRLDHGDRKAMLSAVRAAVNRSRSMLESR
jgi:hypothetical protein